MMECPLVICGFPGIGKSYLFNNKLEIKVSDSDSSKFPKDQFPQNYVEHIKNLIDADEVDIILVSSHQEVRSALQKAEISYVLVYPSPECKENYLERYKQRGSPQAFIDLLDRNWENWIAGCESDPAEKVRLGFGEFLADLFT